MNPSDQDPVEVVIELITRLACGDYDARASPTGHDEDLDAVILGINMLGEEFAAHHTQLEERVRERTVEVEAARLQALAQADRWEQQSRDLRVAMQVTGDFVSMVSHELRTPLTSILGYLEVLDHVEEPIPEEVLHSLTVIRRNSKRLLVLVSDLLVASEMENSPMLLTRAPIDLSELVTRSLDDLGVNASAAGLTLVRDLSPDLVVTADASRLVQVVDNLVSNAIKFTPAGGQISVELVRQVDGVDLIVSDTGIGIDAESLPHLTTKFFRAPEATAAAIPGVGLGLMITQRIVEAHHGTLSFTSREPQGTSVCVHLPADPARAS